MVTRRGLVQGAAALVAATTLLTGCSRGPRIEGAWEPQRAEGTGTPVDLSEVQLNIMGRELTGSDGCARIRAVVDLEDGTLRVGPLDTGEIACGPEQQKAATFVRALLNSQPTAAVDGDWMTLRGAGRVLALLRR